MMLSTLIIDSDSSTCRLLGQWIGASRHLTLGGQARGLAHGLALLDRHVPHAVLCAVELPDGSGFDLLRRLPTTSQVVFLARSANHAAHAFEVDACDYLLKPLSLGRFRKTEERLLARSLERGSYQDRSESGVVVAVRANQEFVAFRELVAVVSVGGNYTELHRATGPSFDTRRTLKDWKQLLRSEPFVHSHRSTLVNLRYVQALGRAKDGERSISIRDSPLRFPVSRRLAASVERALKAKRE